MTNNPTAQVHPVHTPARRSFSLRKPRPQKPDNTVLVSKEATTEEALHFLNEFVTEARKEIRKREKITLMGNVSKTDCGAVTFLGEQFSLTINFNDKLNV